LHFATMLVLSGVETSAFSPSGSVAESEGVNK